MNKNKNVYREKIFIKPKFWGLAFWNYMFMFSKYIEHSKRSSLQHFKTLLFFVPCKKCRIEFKKKLKINPPPNEKNKLFRWIWKFKNEVNARQRATLKLDKKNITLKRALYEQSMLRDSNIICNFFQKLILSMPIYNAVVRTKTPYNMKYVAKKFKMLVEDMMDNPYIFDLLTTLRHQSLFFCKTSIALENN